MTLYEIHSTGIPIFCPSNNFLTFYMKKKMNWVNLDWFDRADWFYWNVKKKKILKLKKINKNK
jgi:hypothetical protein